MKIFLVSILLVFIVTASFGQKQDSDYTLTLNFAPSFIAGSELSIQAKGDSGFIRINIYKSYNKKNGETDNNVVIPVGNLKPLTNFLKTYKFQIKNNIDTIGSHKVFVNGDSVLVYDVSAGLDGINVNGNFTQNNIIKKFAFWSPNKGTENANFVILLFNLLNNAFSGQNTINYLEQLQQYFPHGLGLKKLSDNPLTYKLFGSITSDDEDSLEVFLKNLPLNKKVIIDMSNYSGMGTMFYDDFDQYCAHNTNIYWLNPTFQGLIDLYKIGIPKRQLISKKKITKITVKNGRQTITTVDDKP